MYRIAKDSLSTSAQVDDTVIKLGDDWTNLTKAQAKRLEEAGVKLDTKPTE